MATEPATTLFPKSISAGIIILTDPAPPVMNAPMPPDANTAGSIPIKPTIPAVNPIRTLRKLLRESDKLSIDCMLLASEVLNIPSNSFLALASPAAALACRSNFLANTPAAIPASNKPSVPFAPRFDLLFEIASRLPRCPCMPFAKLAASTTPPFACLALVTAPVTA